MRIALDLDDTLFKNTVIQNACRDINFTGTYSWDLHEIPADTVDLIQAQFRDPDFMCTLEPFEGTQDVVKEMHQRGYELYAVTSRQPSVHSRTFDMVSKYYPDVRDIYFATTSKRQILIDNQFHVLIDDSPKYIEEVMDTDIVKVLISNSHTPYNFNVRDKYAKDILTFKSVVQFWQCYKGVFVE